MLLEGLYSSSIFLSGLWVVGIFIFGCISRALCSFFHPQDLYPLITYIGGTLRKVLYLIWEWMWFFDALSTTCILVLLISLVGKEASLLDSLRICASNSRLNISLIKIAQDNIKRLFGWSFSGYGMVWYQGG